VSQKSPEDCYLVSQQTLQDNRQVSHQAPEDIYLGTHQILGDGNQVTSSI
jgi:hypothetical protein